MLKKSLLGTFLLLVVAVALSGCGKHSASQLTGAQPLDSSTSDGLTGVPFNHNPNILQPESSIPVAGEMHTDHLIFVGANAPRGTAALATTASYSPSQIKTAYGVPSSGGSGTIVIVDAFNDQYALADFNAFSAQFGLPQETSTNVTASTNRVFQIVYASGSKPRNNSGWSQEEDLDIEWAHAMAPNAKIVLIEAASNSNANLYGADDLAATISGAHQCSNSWGGGESSSESGSDSHFNHSGMTYLFSTGDTGGARDYPAASPNVVAVGGTSLLLTGSNTRSSETVWNGTGCGPSSYESRPSYQSGVASVVGTHRGIGDVAAVADPNTGVLVYWHGGWYIFGGTSVACPVIAGIVNVAGANRGGPSAENTFVYGGLGGANFYDVTSGTAGSYHAAAGYDFPTGVGAPIGIAGF